jgi:hypothetical protein
VDLSPVAVQVTAAAGIVGSLAVIWRMALRPALEAIRSIAQTADRLAALAAADPDDPDGRPAIVNATAQIARQGHRTERALRRLDDQGWAVFEEIERAWNAEESHTSRFHLPERSDIMEG